MTTRRPKSITPAMQFMVICESVEHDQDGNISFRRIFDAAQTMGPTPIPIAFTVAVQFRGGTGEHKVWLTITHPAGKVTTTNETSFWLASKAAAHRLDSRVTLVLGDDDFGRFDIGVVLDGRPVFNAPLTLSRVQVTDTSG